MSILGISWSWLSFWLGIDLSYLISGLLIAGGIYVGFVLGTANILNPIGKLLRDIGIGMIVVGLLLAWGTYKESIGAADCEARWKAANYQAQIDRAKQETAAHELAAQVAAEHAHELELQNADQQNQLEDYRAQTEKLQTACRLPTADDDRRMCQLTGNSAVGCKPAK